MLDSDRMGVNDVVKLIRGEPMTPIAITLLGAPPPPSIIILQDGRRLRRRTSSLASIDEEARLDQMVEVLKRVQGVEGQSLDSLLRLPSEDCISRGDRAQIDLLPLADFGQWSNE